MLISCAISSKIGPLQHGLPGCVSFKKPYILPVQKLKKPGLEALIVLLVGLGPLVGGDFSAYAQHIW